MPAAGALVDVTAEQGGSAGDDGGQDLQVQPGEPFPAAFEEAGSGCADQVGHLQWWPRHLFRGERERVQGAGRGPHMALRQVDVNHGFAQVGMAEQQLDGAQVGAGFEQMCGEAMSKSVGMQRLVDPGAFGGLPAGVPDDLVSDRSVGRVMRAAWEQPDGRFGPSCPSESATSRLPRTEVTGLFRSCAIESVRMRIWCTDDCTRSNMRLKVRDKREISSECGPSGNRLLRSSLPIRDTVSLMRSTLIRVRYAANQVIRNPRATVAPHTKRQRSVRRSSICAPPRSANPRYSPPPSFWAWYTTRKAFFHPCTRTLAGAPKTSGMLVTAEINCSFGVGPTQMGSCRGFVFRQQTTA